MHSGHCLNYIGVIDCSLGKDNCPRFGIPVIDHWSMKHTYKLSVEISIKRISNALIIQWISIGISFNFQLDLHCHFIKTLTGFQMDF